MSKQIKKFSKIAIAFGVALALVVLYSAIPSVKADLDNQKVTISDSRSGATGVEYVFEQDFEDTTTTIKCLQVDFCTTATGTCNTPDSMDLTGDVLTIGTAANWGDPFDDTLWGAPTATDANTATFTDDVGETASGTDDNFAIGGITNPDPDAEVTYYARVHAYSDTGCSAPAGGVDSGNAAFAITTSGVSVSATVAETLSFTVSDYAVGFGELGTGDIYYATADENGATSEPGNDLPCKLTISTNAADGAVVTIEDTGSGAAAGLYDSVGANLIAATAPSGVAAGTESYAPYAKNDGANINIIAGFATGGGTAVTLNPQEFVNTNNGPLSSGNTVDLALKAGIDATTPAGSYSDTLILIATPTY